MPHVTVQVTAGATRDQKRRVVERVTAALVEEMDKRPEHIHVVIQEVAEEDWGFSGMLTDEWRTRSG